MSLLMLLSSPPKRNIKQVSYIVLLIVLCFPVFSPAKDASSVKIKVAFEYNKTDLRIKLHDLKPDFMFSVSRTVVTESLKKSPILAPLDSTITLTPEDNQRSFALVVENNSTKARYFFATPHTYHPSEGSFGALFECLCNHHVYKIPPKMIWYRIVRLKVDFNQLKIDKKKLFEIVHSVVEVPENEALTKYKPILYENIEATPKGDL